jgi:hypothetical protein
LVTTCWKLLILSQKLFAFKFEEEAGADPVLAIKLGNLMRLEYVSLAGGDALAEELLELDGAPLLLELAAHVLKPLALGLAVGLLQPVDLGNVVSQLWLLVWGETGHVYLRVL